MFVAAGGERVNPPMGPDRGGRAEYGPGGGGAAHREPVTAEAWIPVPVDPGPANGELCEVLPRPPLGGLRAGKNPGKPACHGEEQR